GPWRAEVIRSIWENNATVTMTDIDGNEWRVRIVDIEKTSGKPSGAAHWVEPAVWLMPIEARHSQ
ncbi:MAG: hypothetical protein AB7G88_07540, partial [Thermomicrobiales bacterium]